VETSPFAGADSAATVDAIPLSRKETRPATPPPATPPPVTAPPVTAPPVTALRVDGQPVDAQPVDAPAVDAPQAETPAVRRPRRIDPVLVRGAMDGDAKAIDRLLSALRPLVTSYCRARLGTWARRTGDADDCAQEILLAVFSVLPRYQGSEETFLPFVYGIAAHKVNDLFRRESRDRSQPLADFDSMDALLAESDPGPAERAERGDALRDIRRSMDILTGVQRQVVILRVLLGFSAADTAAALDIPSAGAVRVVQHRALSRLRRALTTERVVAEPA
jgi:RNA polymerase sigma-70 factor (ECF subfamily)